jgi:hypothetical protein
MPTIQDNPIIGPSFSSANNNNQQQSASNVYTDIPGALPNSLYIIKLGTSFGPK